jgi:FkbM family methyltransferase
MPGGLLIWEGPVDQSDPVIRKDVPLEHRAGYTRAALTAAASRYFEIETIAPAGHEPTREFWICRRRPSEGTELRGEMRDGAKGATKAFLKDHGRRTDEIERILGVRPCPGSLNLTLSAPFDWATGYYRAQILDSTDRRNPDAPWAPRWCRFYPVAVGDVGCWGMRFEGETYPAQFLEVIAPHRLRDLISADAFIEKDGFWWPAVGSVPAQIILEEVRVLDEVLAHVPRRGVAVQAGGNVGVYPARLATHFKTVLTFEPDADNFECLQRNLARFDNVWAHHAALGEALKTSGLARRPDNTGGHFLDGPGDIVVRPIDDLGLDACDFLCLDVEGYEFAVLKGAVKTIATYRPVILFEDKGMSARYGVPKGAAEDWLATTFAYRRIGTAINDVLMGPA